MLPFFYQALASPLGIVLTCSDPQAAIQKLHKARRESGDPALKDIVIARSRTNPASEIWLARNNSSESNAEET